LGSFVWRTDPPPALPLARRGGKAIVLAAINHSETAHRRRQVGQPTAAEERASVAKGSLSDDHG
jgi:hypothetical protein